MRESQRAAHPLQACLRLVAPAALTALAVVALAVVVGRFPQRLLRALGVVAVAVAVVVTLFLERLILARARVLASPRPSMAAPDSATE